MHTMYPNPNNSRPTSRTTGSSKLPPRGAYGCATIANLSGMRDEPLLADWPVVPPSCCRAAGTYNRRRRGVESWIEGIESSVVGPIWPFVGRAGFGELCAARGSECSSHGGCISDWDLLWCKTRIIDEVPARGDDVTLYVDVRGYVSGYVGSRATVYLTGSWVECAGLSCPRGIKVGYS